jgi:hypothetical protein
MRRFPSIQALRLAAVLAVLATAVIPLRAQPLPAADEEGALFYAIQRGAVLYHRDDTTQAYLHVKFREPVHVLGDAGNGWKRVRTRDGAHGLMRAELLSDIWIRISKRTQTVLVYRGTELIHRFAADLGYNFYSDKERRGSAAEPDHWRTPEGEFFVVAKNPRSQFYKALVLNYPNAEDAERGFRDGLISQAEYDAIRNAEVQYAMPPMSTALGGYIELHGDGTGKRNNWTQGCVAIPNTQMDIIWDLVSVGTPVLIDS